MPETQGRSEGPDILARIVATKTREVARLRPRENALGERVAEAPPPRDLAAALRGGDEVAVMAEVKRRSPGAGAIRPGLIPAEIAAAYQEAGAAAVSVLTDAEYFGGSLRDLEEVRKAVSLPILRKDFVIHPLQLLEARGAGADGVLLIVRILTDVELRSLHSRALELGLTALVEVHDPGELDRALAAGAEVVGINNRDLSTFTTSLDVTLGMVASLPSEVTVISESGIKGPEEVDRLGEAGVHGILVGESFLRAPAPGRAAAELVGRPRVEAPDA